jgi:hypothetical protein
LVVATFRIRGTWAEDSRKKSEMVKLSCCFLAGLIAASVWAPLARAEGPGNPTGGHFATVHPRRDEVNTRVDNQRGRINEGVRSGELTQGQAAQFAPTIVPSKCRNMPKSGPMAATSPRGNSSS